MADRYDEEISRLAHVLATGVRLSSHTRQALEQQMGLSSGYLSKILGGSVELRVRHVLMLAEALGVETADLFRLSWPDRLSGEAGAASRRLIEGVQAALGQSPRPSRPEADRDFDEQVKRSLGRLLGLTGDEPGPE